MVQPYNFTTANIEQLSSFIRGELTAVETYEQAIDKLEGKPDIVATLRECQRSHRERAEEMSGYVRQMGGTPPTSPGPWGSMAKLLEGGAKLFGEKAAVSVLEEGEDHGLADYQRDLDVLAGPVRALVEHRILPAQKRTHDRLSAIQERL